MSSGSRFAAHDLASRFAKKEERKKKKEKIRKGNQQTNPASKNACTGPVKRKRRKVGNK